MLELLRLVERHLRRHKITPSRFGKDAAGDPQLVFDMRRGRRVGARLDAQVRGHIASDREGAGTCTGR